MNADAARLSGLNSSVPAWFQFGLRAELILSGLVLAFGLAQILTAYGLFTGKPWSYRLGLATPLFGLAISASFALLYLSAPADLGLPSWSDAYSLVWAAIWVGILWTYIRRPDVKGYLRAELPGRVALTRQ